MVTALRLVIQLCVFLPQQKLYDTYFVPFFFQVLISLFSLLLMYIGLLNKICTYNGIFRLLFLPFKIILVSK